MAWKKTIETRINSKTVASYEESPDVKGTRKLSAGTIGIQAHDPGSVVLIKNIKVRRAADENMPAAGR